MSDTAVAPAPDPSVTTTPVSNGAENTAPSTSGTPGADNNFDYLDTPDGTMVGDDPLEFKDDLEEKAAAEAELEGEKRVDESGEKEAISTDPESEKHVDDSDKESPELVQQVEQLQEKATLYEEFDVALRQNPAAVAEAIIEGMDARQKTALLAKLGVQSDRQTFEVEAYEPQGEMEAAIAQRWQDIESIPQLVSETQSLSERMQTNQDTLIQTFAPHITEANLGYQLALAKIEALCEALDIQLPDPDMKKITAMLKDPKVSYMDAVRKSVNYKPVVEDVKQRRAPRPRTPGNESRAAEKIPPGTGMVEISRRMGLLR